jgi:hypothetical protein
MVAATEHAPSTALPQKAVYYTICFDPLAISLGNTDLAILVQRLHYWMQNDYCGYLLRDGTKRVYFGYKELQEQFPWWSIDQIGRHIRHLEQRGWVISDRFYNLNRNVGFVTKAPHFQEDNQRKWYWLNYQKIFEDTGFDLLFNADPVPTPPKRRPRSRGANLQKCTEQSAQAQNPICKNAESSIDKEFHTNSKSNKHNDFEKDLNSSQQQVTGEFSAPVEIPILGDDDEEITQEKLTDSVKDQNSPGAALQNLTEADQIEDSLCDTEDSLGDTEVAVEESAQDFDPDKAVAALVSWFDSGRPVQTQEPRQYRIRIEELDEEIHEILWKHQERLEALNVDLEAAKIHQAIIDNPQYLEDAIYAFYEASAKGALESKQATGYLYNALRHGWKPREQCTVVPPVETNPQRHLGHPDWHIPTLTEIIERKNLIWKVPALRASVEQWARQTPGVILTEDGVRLIEQEESADVSTDTDSSLPLPEEPSLPVSEITSEEAP